VKEYLIGTGGWAYFRVPGLRPLTAYSRIFNFVEVNSTFYQMPSLKEVERWRKAVPPEFEFAVRAHQSITHRYRLRPVQPVLETFKHMKQICNVLNSEILHLQVPPSFTLDEAFVHDLKATCSQVSLGRLRLALEIRRMTPLLSGSDLSRTMQDLNIIHCTDLSKGEMPSYESDVLYTRLFGKGKHNVYQPTDHELAEIDTRASNSKSQKVVMSFHFVRMYKDAARLKTYKETNKFPMVTRSTGLSSLKEVLDEDAKFPSTKSELVENQGWKIYDVTETERARAQDLLHRLPEGTYKSTHDVIEALRHSISG
jgi:uncharacterized protein YecE (DUF72 family)